jgi:hypothetical protein
MAKLNAQKTIPVSTPANNQGIEIGFGSSTRNVIKLDPLSRTPIGNIPFDRTFILRVYFDPKAEQDFKDEDVKAFYLVYKNGTTIPLGFYLINSVKSVEGTTAIKATDYDASDNFLKIYPNAIDIVVPALDPNSDYKIFYTTSATRFDLPYIDVFQLFYEGKEKEGINLAQSFKKAANNDRAIVTGSLLSDYYKANKSSINKIFSDYKNDISKRNSALIDYMSTNKSLIVNTTINGVKVTSIDLFDEVRELSKLNTQQFVLKTNAALRIVADGGVIYTGWQKGFNVVTAYFGINISLRPMDVDIPFRTLIKNKRIKFYQRFTANLGVTIHSIAKDEYRANLFSNNNVVIGIGYKISHVINLNFGGLLYNNVDPNPLIAKKSLGVAPYAGISINLLIKDALGDIAKVFSK